MPIEPDETCPKCGQPAYGDWYYNDDEEDEVFYIYCPKCDREEDEPCTSSQKSE